MNHVADKILTCTLAGIARSDHVCSYAAVQAAPSVKDSGNDIALLSMASSFGLSLYGLRPPAHTTNRRRPGYHV